MNISRRKSEHNSVEENFLAPASKKVFESFDREGCIPLKVVPSFASLIRRERDIQLQLQRRFFARGNGVNFGQIIAFSSNY